MFSSQVTLWVMLCMALTIPGLSKAQTPPEAKGLMVINDSSTGKQHSPAAEFTEIRPQGVTFSATLVGGKQYSGLSGHLLAVIDYTNGNRSQLLAKMREVSAAYANAAPLLKPRIKALEEAVASAPPPAPEQKEPRIPEATFGGRTYKNIKPNTLRNGMLGFIHESGVFTVPAGLFSYSHLSKYGTMFPALQQNLEYQQLLGTFAPLVVIGNTTHTGVRLISQTETEVALLTDSGPVTVGINDISKAALQKATEAATNREKLTQEILAREAEIAEKVAQEKERLMMAARERNEREAQERLAKIEADRAAAEANAAMWGTIGSAFVNAMFAPSAYYFRPGL